MLNKKVVYDYSHHYCDFLFNQISTETLNAFQLVNKSTHLKFISISQIFYKISRYHCAVGALLTTY